MGYFPDLLSKYMIGVLAKYYPKIYKWKHFFLLNKFKLDFKKKNSNKKKEKKFTNSPQGTISVTGLKR